MKSESKAYAAEEDKRAQKILKSSDIMEAKDWLALYPKGLFSSNALDEDDFDGTPLAPVVDRLTKAGAARLVVHHAHRKLFLGLVVVLPDDAKARKKIFIIEQELSQVCLQREAEDCGQKYLYYSLQ